MTSDDWDVTVARAHILGFGMLGDGLRGSRHKDSAVLTHAYVLFEATLNLKTCQF
jgi:hypothetical protein